MKIVLTKTGITVIAVLIALTFIATPVGALPSVKVGTGANAVPQAGWAPLTVDLSGWSNNTTITSWLWTFGDGYHYKGKHVYHTYQDGKYTATVKAKTRSGTIVFTKSFTITAYKASFTAAQHKNSNKVQFYYTGNGKPTHFLWNFGDKSISRVKNPAHIYKKDGKYKVSLTVKNSTGSKTVTKKMIVK
jgi:PKD repeat protein